MDVEIITTNDGLDALVPEWTALWARVEQTTPFQSPAWLIPWRRTFARAGLCVAACRQHRRLAAVAAFVDDRGGLALLGAALSDYQDGLFEEELSDDAADAILDALSKRGAERINFDRLPHFSPWLRTEAGAWSSEVRPEESCPVLRLHGAGIAATIPPHQLDNLRYYRKRAAGLGGATLERAIAENLKEFLEGFFYLHRLRWSHVGATGVLADAAVERFHRTAAPALVDAGILRLYRLRIGSRPAAALYSLTHRRRAYYYLSGFDPEYKNVSPGTLIVGHAIEQAIDEGAEEFDFLRGRETYKYLWGAEDRPAYRRTLVRAVAARRHAAEAHP